MSNKDFLSKILTEANFIQSHLERLQKKPDQISALDIDMLADKLKDLYAKLFELETEQSIIDIQSPPVVTVIEKPPVVEVKPGPEMPAPKAPEMIDQRTTNNDQRTTINEERSPTAPSEAIAKEGERTTNNEERTTNNEERTTNNEERTTINEERTTNPEPVAENIEITEVTTSDPVNDPDPIPTPSTQDPEPDTHDPEPEIKTTADLFTGTTTIAESFQADEDRSIAARVVPQGVKDLKMVIGINDKFLFINELFKGSPADYNEAIDKLNAKENAEEATTALNNYRQEFAWSDNSEAYHRLKKLMLSKYSG